MTNSSWKATFIIGAIIISLGIIFHGLLVNNHAQDINDLLQKNKSPQQPGISTIRIKNAAIWGKKDAPVTLVEFSDFDCPFCLKVYNEILPELKKDYIDTGKVRFIFKNAPLDIHTNAKTKAVAALCAQQQNGDGGFYTYHNKLYENAESSESVNVLLTRLAVSSKLDIKEFSKCLDTNQNLKDRVDLDLADALQVEANGTPTWFVGKTGTNSEFMNGIRVVGAQPYSVLRILINELLTNEK